MKRSITLRPNRSNFQITSISPGLRWARSFLSTGRSLWETAELKLKKAASEFNSAKKKLSEEAFNTSTSLADVAKKTNLKLESLDQDWLTQANGKAAGLPDVLINAAFSEDVLKKKHNSDLIFMDKDTV